MDKYYLGYDDTNSRWVVFAADSREQATPEITGYFAVSYEIETADEAHETCKVMNFNR